MNCLLILEHAASGVQVGDIERVIVQYLFKVQWNYIRLMVSYKFLWWWPQLHDEFKEYEEKKNSNFEI